MAGNKSPRQASKQLYNVPNSLTLGRFILAVLVCVMIPLGQYRTAMVLFVIAASTDWMDGYWARKYDQVTQFGRIFDPFVDKVIICGAFVLLAAEPGSGIAGWMAVVVVCRELLVTGLRSYLESAGVDFSAKWSGKWKMVLQCVAVVASLFALMTIRDYLLVLQAQGEPIPERYISRLGDVQLREFFSGSMQWIYWTLIVSVWGAVLLTIYSGLVYVMAAARHIRKD